MAQFILTNIFFLSIGVVLFILVRALPRLEDTEEEGRQTVFERMVTSDIPHRIDTAINVFLGKIFRKVKVQLMRFDNYLTEKLKVLNTENGNGKNGSHTDFIKELSGPIEDAVEQTDNHISQSKK